LSLERDTGQFTQSARVVFERERRRQKTDPHMTDSMSLRRDMDAPAFATGIATVALTTRIATRNLQLGSLVQQGRLRLQFLSKETSVLRHLPLGSQKNKLIRKIN
jgi:hypothetical protein